MVIKRCNISKEEECELKNSEIEYITSNNLTMPYVNDNDESFWYSLGDEGIVNLMYDPNACYNITEDT